MDGEVTFARDTLSGDIIHISNAKKDENGKWNCICLKCGTELIAVRGTEKLHHFRHKSEEVCPGAQESAIHKTAKEIIKKNSKIIIAANNTFSYNLTELEKLLEDPLSNDRFEIDALLNNGEKKLAVEIAYKHFNEIKKDKFFVSNKIEAIEIDINKIDPQISYEDLETLIVNEIKNKRIIYPCLEFKKTTGFPTWAKLLILAILAFLGIKYLSDKGK